MTEKIVGIMWNKNEGDILEETVSAALSNVDSLFIADDNSTDNSWDIIQSFKTNSKVEYITNKRVNPKDVGQRQALLDEVRKRYKPEDTWVQVIESDVMILDTDIREAIRDFSIDDVVVSWQVLDAVRHPGTWKEEDNYPNWTKSIKEVLPYAHRLESMTYTFRPLPLLTYNLDTWRPWPQGFSNYISNGMKTGKRRYSPLLAHYGYRGPTHFYKKYNSTGKLKFHRNGVWDLSSPESIEKTVPFFNGDWNTDAHAMSREGWKKSRSGRQWKGLEANDAG